MGLFMHFEFCSFKWQKKKPTLTKSQGFACLFNLVSAQISLYDVLTYHNMSLQTHYPAQI